MKRLSQLFPTLILLTAIVGAATAQNTDRPVIVIGQPTPRPTVTPTPRPNVTRTPVATPTPSFPAGQTAFDLQAKIRQTLLRPELRRGSIGIKISALDSGRVIFEENSEKYFVPASNMKSFTVAAALERLSPNFRFVTSVYAGARPDANGTIKGDLTIYGRGDISISTAFNSSDYYRGLDNLVDRIVQAGVKRIEGNLVGDDSYFSGSAVPYGWEWDDMQWYYGAEVSALGLNDNAVDLSVGPGGVGQPCVINLKPFNPIFKILNTCRTTSSKEKRDLTVKKDLDQNVLEISGTMPAGDKGFSDSVTVSRPAELFVALLKQRLEQKGVTFTGQARVIGEKEKALQTAASSIAPVQIAELESVPFSLIASKTMKPSQNMYTETILWTLGEKGRGPAVMNWGPADKNPFLNLKSSSSDRGVFVVKQFLSEIGVAPDGIIQYDGSGLSRHNLVSPAALVQLYTYMATRSRYANIWLDSLPVGGVDGTLRNRFKGQRTNGNVRGKTGTLDQVSALSGYVTTAGGERVVFSVIVNGVAGGGARTSIIDEIVGNIAGFSGRL